VRRRGEPIMNLNRRAETIVEGILAEAEELRITSMELENGSRIVDCGIQARGSLEAGRRFAEACMGGLGKIGFSMEEYGDLLLPTVTVRTDHPAVACLASQKAGWSLKGEKFFALGSGPARILAGKPKETLEKIGYRERSDTAVLAMECAKYPPLEVVEGIAEACGIGGEDLILLVAPTASLPGSVQISARVVETALYKIDHMGVDPLGIESALGEAPVAPIVGDDNRMMGVTNDMIIYGGKVCLASTVEIDVSEVPSTTSEAYGKPFLRIFQEANYDFYKIHPAIFAPAEVAVSLTSTPRLEKAGRVNPEVLRRSLLEGR
jgi:methenyltetrahydromethanopterin cyclohydrolase